MRATVAAMPVRVLRHRGPNGDGVDTRHRSDRDRRPARRRRPFRPRCRHRNGSPRPRNGLGGARGRGGSDRRSTSPSRKPGVVRLQPSMVSSSFSPRPWTDRRSVRRGCGPCRCRPCRLPFRARCRRERARPSPLDREADRGDGHGVHAVESVVLRASPRSPSSRRRRTRRDIRAGRGREDQFRGRTGYRRRSSDRVDRVRTRGSGLRPHGTRSDWTTRRPQPSSATFRIGPSATRTRPR